MSDNVTKPQSTAGRPKYSDMILEAVVNTIRQGKKKVSRPAIMNFVTAVYNLDPAAASRHINLNLKKMLESGQLKPAAAPGKKGAGSFRLGQEVDKKSLFKMFQATKDTQITKNRKTRKPWKTGASDEKDWRLMMLE